MKASQSLQAFCADKDRRKNTGVCWSISNMLGPEPDVLLSMISDNIDSIFDHMDAQFRERREKHHYGHKMRWYGLFTDAYRSVKQKLLEELRKRMRALQNKCERGMEVASSTAAVLLRNVSGLHRLLDSVASAIRREIEFWERMGLEIDERPSLLQIHEIGLLVRSFEDDVRENVRDCELTGIALRRRKKPTKRVHEDLDKA